MKISAVRNMMIGAVLLVPVILAADPQPPPPNPHRPHQGPARNFRRRPPKAFFAKLTDAERARIDQLAREGKKEELRKVMKELFFKYRPEEMKQLDALSGKYLKTADEKERAAIRGEMAKIARQLFRKRQDFTRGNIAEAERQLKRAQEDLERLKKHYQRNEENMEKIIADRVDQMCLPPEQRKKFDWKGRHGGQPAAPRKSEK